MRMSAAEIEFKALDTWKPGTIARSAEFAVKLMRYHAPHVYLIPVVCAERDGKTLSASKPVSVAIHESDDGTIAENEKLQIYAYGSNPERALADFRSQLFELYSHYWALQADDVIGEAVELRTLFLANFTLR
jgi:hypothetical protein